MQTKVKERLWNRYFILILCLSTISLTGFSMMTPIMTKYAISLGATVTMAGVIAGIFSAVALVGRPIAGLFADQLNKKRMLIFATVGLAVSSLGYGFSPNWVVLLFFRLLHGVFFTFSSTASMSLGTMYIPKSRLGEGVGYLGLGVILALAIGPNLGIWMMGQFGYQWVFYCAFGLSTVASLLMNLLFYPKADSQGIKSKRKITLTGLVDMSALAIALHNGFFSLMNGLIGAFLVNMGEEKGIAGVGTYFLVSSVVLFVIRPFSGRLLDKRGLAFIVYPAYFFAIAAGFLLGASTSLWMIIAAAVLFALGLGSSQPALQASCVRMLGPGRVGVATSTYFIGADIGMGLGPMVGGAIAGAMGFGSLYLLGAAVLMVGLLLFALQHKKRWINASVVPEAAEIASQKNA